MLLAGVINEYGIRQEAVDSEGASSVISNSGIYTFTFGVDGTVVPARFTYVYKKIGDEWKILSHHSSQLPTKLTPSPFTGTQHTFDHISVNPDAALNSFASCTATCGSS
jgi:hypothetical protein